MRSETDHGGFYSGDVMDTVQLRLDPGPTAPSTLGGILLATLLIGGCGPDLETTDPPDTRDTTEPDAEEVDAGATDAADAPPFSPETDSTDVPPDTADGDTAAIDTTDGSGADGSADADTSAPPVRVSLRLGTRPIPAATVVFHDRDGNILGREVTNAKGEASHVVPDGAMVTYGFGGIGSEPVFRTVTGVQAGESLDLRIAADQIPSAVGAVRVDLPPEIAGADNYEVSIGCNTTLAMPGTDVVELDILDSCANGGDEFDVVARAFDGDEPVAY
ncbi:MAG: hypothetical protein ABEK29_10275, partial [Bradymonadaceae bacterium]